MKRAISGFVIVPVLLLFSSCIKDVEMKTARAGNKFLIDVPKSMTEADDLKSGADLQLRGRKDFPVFLYCLSDDKNSVQTMGVNFTAEEIYFLEAEEITGTGENGRVSLPKETFLSYLKCVHGQVYVTRKGGELQFEVYVCEGGPRFYRIVMGGKPADMKKHEKLIKEVFQSFREWTDFRTEG